MVLATNNLHLGLRRRIFAMSEVDQALNRARRTKHNQQPHCANTLGQSVDIDEENNSLSFQSVEEAQRQAIERKSNARPVKPR